MGRKFLPWCHRNTRLRCVLTNAKMHFETNLLHLFKHPEDSITRRRMILFFYLPSWVFFFVLYFFDVLLVRVSARFQLARVRVIGSRMYITDSACLENAQWKYSGLFLQSIMSLKTNQKHWLTGLFGQLYPVPWGQCPVHLEMGHSPYGWLHVSHWTSAVDLSTSCIRPTWNIQGILYIT